MECSGLIEDDEFGYVVTREMVMAADMTMKRGIAG
jgi:hypothetical protein